MAGSGKPPRINFASWPTGGLRSQATAKVRRFFDFPGNSGCLRCPAHTSSFVLYARTNTSIEASFVDRIDWLFATSLLQLTCARCLSTIPSHENPQIDRDSCRCKPRLPELALRAKPFHCRNCPFCPRGRHRTHQSSRQIPRRQP